MTIIKVTEKNVEQQEVKEEVFPTGDFLTNGEHMIIKCGNLLSCHNMASDDSETRVVAAEKAIADMTMNWPHVVALHQDSFSVADFLTTTIQMRGHSSTKLVALYSNDHVVAVLNYGNLILIYKWAGEENT